MSATNPVVHHVELCVSDATKVLSSLQMFGFYPYAHRTTAICDQFAVKVGGAVFVITERQKCFKGYQRNGNRLEPMTVLCCENQESHEVDTVFNVALVVKNVEGMTARILSNGASVVQPVTKVRDDAGELTYSIVRSCCGNVVHTLINKDNYHGAFLPGFESTGTYPEDEKENRMWDELVTHVDHVTLACYPGDSHRVISFYEKCFGMRRFSINRDDDDDEGLILDGGVGLRLRAMEYWRCAETGLSYETEDSARSERNPNGIMLVVVESLPGQKNCNVETFLKEHERPGVEHIALSTQSMIRTVSKMVRRGVNFRQPPAAYYNQIDKTKQIEDIGEDINSLKKLGILLDSEVPDESDSPKAKYLMQIFAHPLFSKKTFFIEVIQRCGARGLGAGNIIALVRCIREEEDRKRKQNAFLPLQENCREEEKGQVRS